MNVLRSVIAITSLATVLYSFSASARVFDFKDEHWAIYIGGTFGNSSAGDGAYALSSGNGVNFDKKVLTTSSAEAGLLISLSRINLKLGTEYVMPRDLKGIKGSDASDTELFSLDSNVSALVLGGSLEMIAYQKPRARFLIGVGYGYAMASLTNRYTMTPAGTTALGVGDFSEEATGTGTMIQGYTGWELNITDVWTVTFHIGYRDLQIPGFKSTKATTAISGNQSDGQEILNMDGSARALNLSGAFAGINFRFYL